MDANLSLILPLILVLLLVLVGLFLWMAFRPQPGTPAGSHFIQTELLGRLSQMSEAQASSQSLLAERLQTQERHIMKVLEERLADVTKRVGDGLQQTTEKTAQTMHDLR